MIECTDLNTSIAILTNRASSRRCMAVDHRAGETERDGVV